MKKSSITIISILMLVLTACGSGNTTDTQSFGSDQNGDPANTELPLASKLAIASFKLEDTDNAITPTQAAEFLPLWQVYEQLSTSDTAAQEEITALVEQIQETMTKDQTNAIDAMNLTPQDIFTTMQEQGIQFGGRQQNNQGDNQSNGNNFQRPGGGNGEFFVRPADGGGPDGGPGGGFGGQNLSPEQIATAQAARAENGGGFRFNNTPAPLIEALVKLLQEKASG